MSVWNDQISAFSDDKKDSVCSQSNFWGCVSSYEITSVATSGGRRPKGIAFTEEAYRFLKASNTKISSTTVQERNKAVIVEFRGFKIYVLDWVALIETDTGNSVHFYGSGRL